MRLTVLGSSASYAGAGQACAGHLIEGGGARVLFDCGNGVLANLAQVLDPVLLDAVFVTHRHVDHFADIYALQALVRYAPGGPAAPLDLYVPSGLFERMGCLLSENGRRELAGAFTVHELAADVDVRVADLSVTPRLVDHTEPTFALCATADSAIVCYTSDTAPGERVMRAAQGCDLLLAEATLPEQYANQAPHLTARQAGELARDAGVGALVLTHVWPTNDRDVTFQEARKAYGGPVAVAQELDVFDIPAHAGRGELQG